MKRRVQLMITDRIYIEAKSIAGSLDMSYSAFIELALHEKIESIKRIQKKTNSKKNSNP